MRSRGGWIDVPADPYVFVVNIGDMLERMTRGGYRSNPHRVRNLSGADRLSFPLFLDPSWDATVTPLPETAFRDLPADDSARRWDGQSVHAWEGVIWRLPHRQGGEGLPGPRRQTALSWSADLN